MLLSNNTTIIHEGLKEVNFGSWEGRTFEEIFETELFQQFTLPNQKHPFPNINEQKEVDLMLQSQGLYDELIFLLNKFSFTSTDSEYLN